MPVISGAVQSGTALSGVAKVTDDEVPEVSLLVFLLRLTEPASERWAPEGRIVSVWMAVAEANWFAIFWLLKFSFAAMLLVGGVECKFPFGMSEV
jgi:hypothetical protein